MTRKSHRRMVEEARAEIDGEMHDNCTGYVCRQGDDPAPAWREHLCPFMVAAHGNRRQVCTCCEECRKACEEEL